LVESLVSFNGDLTQSLVLTGPARLDSPTFGANAQINGPSRIAITTALTCTSNFYFGAAVQLYLLQPTGIFQVTLTAGANQLVTLNFLSTPSLFNPLNFNQLNAPNFAFNSNNANNFARFQLTSAFNIGNLAVNSGIVRFTSSSVSANSIVVNGLATLWVDLTSVTAQSTFFNANPDGTNPSNYQLTIGTQIPPPAITTQTVVYKGNLVLNVVNSPWTGSVLNAVTATSANGPTTLFFIVTGTNPGQFTYAQSRSGSSLIVTRNTNAPTFFPSQSNGPSPPVSSSAIITINIFIFFIAIIFMI